MQTVKLSSKGQFILPKSIRDRHQWSAGTELIIIDRGSEIIIKPAAVFPPSTLEPPDSPSVYHGEPLTIEDMDHAVAAEAGKQK